MTDRPTFFLDPNEDAGRVVVPKQMIVQPPEQGETDATVEPAPVLLDLPPRRYQNSGAYVWQTIDGVKELVFWSREAIEEEAATKWNEELKNE